MTYVETLLREFREFPKLYLNDKELHVVKFISREVCEIFEVCEVREGCSRQVIRK